MLKAAIMEGSVVKLAMQDFIATFQIWVDLAG